MVRIYLNKVYRTGRFRAGLPAQHGCTGESHTLDGQDSKPA